MAVSWQNLGVRRLDAAFTAWTTCRPDRVAASGSRKKLDVPLAFDGDESPAKSDAKSSHSKGSVTLFALGFPADRRLNSPRVRDDEPIQLPIDGVLDLHTFRPSEIKNLVADYLAECQARKILRVRIIHGKGIGNLRRTVHALLAKHPAVVEFHLANEPFGG